MPQCVEFNHHLACVCLILFYAFFIYSGMLESRGRHYKQAYVSEEAVECGINMTFLLGELMQAWLFLGGGQCRSQSQDNGGVITQRDPVSLHTIPRS